MKEKRETEKVRGKHPEKEREEHNENSEMYTEWKINTESHSKTIKGEWRRE